MDPDAPCNGDPRDTYSGGDWIPYFDDYIAAQGNNGGFERVIVSGNNFDPNTIAVCREYECREYLSDLSTVIQQSPTDFTSAVEQAAGVTGNKEDACKAASTPGTGPESTKRIANPTSRSSSDLRLDAATVGAQSNGLLTELTVKNRNLFISVLYAKNGGYEIEFTFSDGGKESFKYVINAPTDQRLTRIDGTLKVGTGVSKCPR